MILIEQTVEIPADRHLRLDLDLPESVPDGKTNVVLLIPFPEKIGVSPVRPLEHVKREAARKAAERRASGRDPFEELRNSMKGRPFLGGVDGVACQRSLRDEWPD
jgi:hypothetical protein